MKRHGRRYLAASKLVTPQRRYPLDEALAVLERFPKAKFDETVELALRLGVDPGKTDQAIRGSVALPKGIGKARSVIVFVEGATAQECTEAGALAVGGADLAKRVEEGWTDFDVAIATPDMMPVVGQLGRILGPQGKMPNPKVGTVTDDVEKAVSDSKSGKVEYRTDRQAIVHMAIGKASFDADKLLDNYSAVLDEIVRAKPASAKGKYIVSATLASTMGPGVRVDTGGKADRDQATTSTSQPVSEETPAEPVEEPAAA